MEKLTQEWNEVKKSLAKWIEQSNAIDTQHFNLDELDQKKQEIATWDQQVSNYLASCFGNPKNQYWREFYSAHRPSYQMGAKNLQQHRKELSDMLYQKNWYLHGMILMLDVCDAIVRPDEIDLQERAKFNTQQKLTLLMEKLYEVYDDNYYPAEEILIGNGINLKRSDEARELANILRDNGYAELLGGMGSEITIKLTAIGAMTVEQAAEPVRENYDHIDLPPQEMNQKIDEIIAELKKQCIGQEILYDELQELKELYVKLNKKSFGQVLKGKLIDLAIGKLVENDTIGYIYYSITNNTLRLPKF